MKLLKRCRILAVLISALAGLVMMTTVVHAQVEILESQGISYLAGGVGLEEREATENLAHFFNLKLTFAEKAGNYVGDVRVSIKKPTGEVVTEIVANGPLLYVALPPGRYVVEAVYEMRTQSHTMSVAALPQKTTQLFRW